MENPTRVDDLVRNDEPRKVAVIYDGKHYRYEDMFVGMLKVAANLVSLQLYTDKIIILLGNRPEAIMAMAGISYAGGTFIPLPSSISSHRLEEIVNDSGATAIITDQSFFETVNLLGDTPTLRACLDIDNLQDFGGYECARSIPNEIAALMYTSGTTGKAKGVICTHEKMMAATSSINAYMMHIKRDIIATCLPLSHGYGLYQIFTVFAEGGTILLEKNFSYPERTLQRIVDYGATGFAAVPSMIHMIMQVDMWEDYLENLTYITTAGAPLPAPTFEKLMDVLPDVEIIPMYGQAECVRTLAYTRKAKLNADNVYTSSCGVAIPDTETRVLVDGEPKEEGEGELLVKSPHVMNGYWNKPEETTKTFVDGWLHTGDIFGIDEYGLHFFIGRNDEVIKIKGERCAPIELDNALMLMPGVTEAAAFPIEDKFWGKRFVVYVATDKADDTVTKAKVMRFCKANVEAHLMPKDVVVCGTIPKNNTGKISRVELKQLYEGRNGLQC